MNVIAGLHVANRLTDSPSQNFVIVMITPTIIDKLQWKAYLIFMCTNLAFVPLVYFCYPETTNLTLEEIVRKP